MIRRNLREVWVERNQSVITGASSEIPTEIIFMNSLIIIALTLLTILVCLWAFKICFGWGSTFEPRSSLPARRCRQAKALTPKVSASLRIQRLSRLGL